MIIFVSSCVVFDRTLTAFLRETGIGSMRWGGFDEYARDTSAIVRKENDGHGNIIVNPYNRKTPHKKQPGDATIIPVRNPYKTPCSQRKADAPLRQWVTSNTRVSVHYFILRPHTAIFESSPHILWIFFLFQQGSAAVPNKFDNGKGKFGVTKVNVCEMSFNAIIDV